MEEIWKDISGFEGIYQVSNFGRVQVLPRPRKSKSGTTYYSKAKLLKFQEDADGYYGVGLHKDGKQFDYRVNRLVGITFIPNPNNLPIVHHKDNNKKNNCVDNLEWVSVSVNTQHAVDTCRLTFDNARLAKISQLGVAKTRKPVKCLTTGQEYYSISECSADLGISNDAIVRHIVMGQPIDDKVYVFSNAKDMDWAASVKSKYEPYKAVSVHCKPVRCITTGQTFSSRKHASEVLDISPDSISMSIKHDKPVKGYQFKEIGQDDE